MKAITGIGYLGKRESLINWREKYAERPKAVRDRIEDYLSECNYAAPVYRFQKTIRISLETLRNDIPNFIVPRMYYYLDGSVLLEYLKERLVPDGDMLCHEFDKIANDDIC